MAEGKKVVLVYADWIEKFEELNDEEAGKLIKHFFRYVNDLNPIAPDRITKLMFVDIKNTLKRDLDKYKEIKEERSYNGRLGNLKRYNPDLYELVINEDKTLKQAEVIAKTRLAKKNSPSENNLAKLADKDSDSVTDSDKVKEKEINNINKSLFDIEVNTSNVDEFRPRLKQDLENTFKEENIDNSKFTKQCKVVGQWLENVAMTNKISIDTVKVFIDQFDAHLINYGEQKRTLKDFKQHFTNWLPKQNLSQFRTKPVGRSNQVNYGN